jgi:hypothetical protein
MISDRKRRIGIHAAAVLSAWLWSWSSPAQDTSAGTTASHIYPSPFGPAGAVDPAPAQGNKAGGYDQASKIVFEACESLRRLLEQSGMYRDQPDCVVMPFPTTDLVSPKLDDWTSKLNLDAPAKSDPVSTDRLVLPQDRLGLGDPVQNLTARMRLEDALSANNDLAPESPSAFPRTYAPKPLTMVLGPDRTEPPIAGRPADPNATYLSYLLDCKRKEKVKTVAETSRDTFVGSNLITITSARTELRGLGANSSLIETAAPRIVRVARSAPWKVGLVAVMATSTAIEAYQFFYACE